MLLDVQADLFGPIGSVGYPQFWPRRAGKWSYSHFWAPRTKFGVTHLTVIGPKMSAWTWENLFQTLFHVRTNGGSCRHFGPLTGHFGSSWAKFGGTHLTRIGPKMSAWIWVNLFQLRSWGLLKSFGDIFGSFWAPWAKFGGIKLTQNVGLDTGEPVPRCSTLFQLFRTTGG